jgi:hypothetical protein
MARAQYQQEKKGMKIVLLNEVKSQISQYLEETQREDIVVTKNGRAGAIIHAITDEDLEDYLFKTDHRFIARIQALRAQYRREGSTPLRDVRRELGLKHRAKKRAKRD